MLNELFSSVLTGETGFLGFLAYSAASIFLGLLAAWCYTYKNHCNKGFVQSLVVLPLLVQVVIMLVNGSIGTGVAVAGAFSLVRFRSVPGGAREIVSIFLSMAIGLATGMGYLAVAALLTVFACCAGLLLARLDFGEKQTRERILRITIPESLDYEGVFEDLMESYTSRWELVSVRTANMGSLYKLSYRITMKPGAGEKAFLDDLRCRNGNLEISCGKISSNEELL